MSAAPPAAVLSDALIEAIGGRTVRAAVFTTFSFDPGFFEEHVLPLLFDRPFSQVRKVRLLQLEDALHTVDELAVYYDRTALAQESESPQLDVRRLDVRRATGCFHPKLLLLLVDNDQELDETDENAVISQSLLVGVASANLTRAGWWENVEAFHFEEIEDRDVSRARIPFRSDLLSLLLQVRRSAPEGEEHAALDQIHTFLLERTVRGEFTHRKSGGRYYTRLFLGQEPLADWLVDLRLARDHWHLEVISPFFDRGDAGVLEDLLGVVEPRSCRVFLPEAPDGTALVDPTLYAAVGALAEWGRLPGSLVDRAGAARQTGLAPRRVHAKVYRFWADTGEEFVIVGSPNLTRAGHGRYRAGNLEAAYLVDCGGTGDAPAAWLESLASEAKRFVETSPAEDDAGQPMPVDLSLRFDWERGVLAYRLAGAPEPLEVAEPSGRPLFRLASPQAGPWVELGPAESEMVRALLGSTSILLARQGPRAWRVLVREERMAYKPSILTTLTPEEILAYWSLLSDEQREEFIEEKLAAEASLEGLPAGGASRRYAPGTTMFDRFAGVFHAFECLRAHVERALEDGADREAEARLFGEKYDSLPVLLHKVVERHADDPILAYVTVLCARQLRERLRRAWPEFWADHAGPDARLVERLAGLERVRDALPLDSSDAEQGFLDWYEEMFRLEVPVAEGEPE